MNHAIYHKHKNHKIEIIDKPFKIGVNLAHPGKIMCAQCDVMLKWIGKKEIDFIHANNVKDLENLTFGEFTTLYYVMTNKPVVTSKPEVKKIYLKVQYSEKDKVRMLGAKWDKQVKKWYVNSDSPKAKYLEQWMTITQVIKQKEAPKESFVNDESHDLGVSRLQRIFQKTSKNTP